MEPGIKFEDGFGTLKNSVRLYEPARLFDESTTTRIIKPHGAIDWYFATPYGEGHRQSKWTIFDSEPFDGRTNYGYYPMKGEASFLSGIGKEEEYQSSIFGDMVEAFQRSLRQTSIVIESGFGWQDYGMRSILMRYLKRSDSNRLLSLHPSGDLSSNTLFDAAGYRPRGVLRTLPKYMSHEDVSWKEIKKVLGLP